MSDTAAASPKVPGLEPTFRHLDDPDQKWQEVRSVQRADGTKAPTIEENIIRTIHELADTAKK